VAAVNGEAGASSASAASLFRMKFHAWV
ncbi:unnamed protein product, partial [Didymodactylos carnosus]